MSWFTRKPRDQRKGSTPPQGHTALVLRGDGTVDQADYIRRLEARVAMSDRELLRLQGEALEKDRRLSDLHRELTAWRTKHGDSSVMSMLCKALDRQQGAMMLAFTNGELVYGNDAAERMFGPVTGRQAHHLFLDGLNAPFRLRLEDTQVNRPLPKPPGHELWLAAIDPENGSVHDRVEIRNLDGEALDVALTMQLIEDQAGQRCFVLIEALDIGALSKDELTKLYRREVGIRMMTREIAFYEKIDRVMASPFSVVFLDLDKFKDINSKFTDQGGDEVLRRVGKVMQKCIRSESKDVACRWGGDEFLAVVYGDEATSLLVAERMSEEIRRLEIPFSLPGVGTVKIPITASIGVASCNRGDTYEEIVDRAAKLKSVSKASGRNCVTREMAPLPKPEVIPLFPNGARAATKP